MDDKQTVLEQLQAEFSCWEALLANLSEAEITASRFDENWSLKDVVGHLWAWQQRSIARLEAAQHHREPDYPAWPSQFDPEIEDQPHDLNTWLYAQNRDTPWSTVHKEWRNGFLRLQHIAEVIPEGDLQDANKYPWLEGYPLLAVLQGTLEHHQEHRAYVEPVIEQG